MSIKSAPLLQKSEVLLNAGSINSAPLLRKSEIQSIATNTHHQLKGLVLVSLGSIMFCVTDTLGKELIQKKLPFLQVILIRYLVMWVLSGLFIVIKRCRGENMPFFGPKKQRLGLIMRAVVLFFCVVTSYWSFIYLPVATTSSIARTFPLITAVLSHWGCCGKVERLSKVGWLLSLISFTGASLMISFVKVDNGFIGMLLAEASALFWALEVITIRNSGDGVHWVQIEFIAAFVFSFCLVPLGLFIQYVTLKYIMMDTINNIFDVYITPVRWGETVILGVLVFVSFGCYTQGFQLEEGPTGALMMYLQIPVTYILQYIFFQQGASLIEITGSFLIMLGAMGTVVEKTYMTKMESSKLNQKQKWEA